MLSRAAVFTNDRYLKLAMVFLLGLGLLGSNVSAAKSQVTRIEVIRGKTQLLSIEGPAASGFTIWSGPGTGSDVGMPTNEGDIAAWNEGAVPAPGAGPVYNVMFLCEACEPARKDDWRCYGIRYAPGVNGAPGLIQIPAANDQDFPRNLQTIYRGVEGQWFRASAKWEQVVRGRIQGALSAAH